jgi:Trk K+ transport system NAD-binding subunit
MRRLFPEQSVTEWTDPTASLSLLERALPPAWAGRALHGISQADRYQLVAVTRAGQARIVTPDLVGQDGDVLTFLVHRDARSEFDRSLGGERGGELVGERHG